MRVCVCVCEVQDVCVRGTLSVALFCESVYTCVFQGRKMNASVRNKNIKKVFSKREKEKKASVSPMLGGSPSPHRHNGKLHLRLHGSWTIRGKQRPRDEEGISLKMRCGDSGAERWGGGGLCV